MLSQNGDDHAPAASRNLEQFNSRDAGRKLERLYPVKEPSSVDHKPPVPTEETKG